MELVNRRNALQLLAGGIVVLTVHQPVTAHDICERIQNRMWKEIWKGIDTVLAYPDELRSGMREIAIQEAHRGGATSLHLSSSLGDEKLVYDIYFAHPSRNGHYTLLNCVFTRDPDLVDIETEYRETYEETIY